MKLKEAFEYLRDYQSGETPPEAEPRNPEKSLYVLEVGVYPKIPDPEVPTVEVTRIAWADAADGKTFDGVASAMKHIADSKQEGQFRVVKILVKFMSRKVESVQIT